MVVAVQTVGCGAVMRKRISHQPVKLSLPCHVLAPEQAVPGQSCVPAHSLTQSLICLLVQPSIHSFLHLHLIHLSIHSSVHFVCSFSHSLLCLKMHSIRLLLNDLDDNPTCSNLWIWHAVSMRPCNKAFGIPHVMMKKNVLALCLSGNQFLSSH